MLTLGHTKRIEGTGLDVSPSHEDHLFPNASRVGSPATPFDLIPALPIAFPTPAMREQHGPIVALQRVFLVGDHEAREIQPSLVLVDVVRKDNRTYGHLRWVEHRESSGKGHIISYVDGCVEIPFAALPELYQRLREYLAYAKTAQALDDAYADAGLSPHQIDARRAKLLADHGLDDHTVDRARAELCTQRRRQGRAL